MPSSKDSREEDCSRLVNKRKIMLAQTRVSPRSPRTARWISSGVLSRIGANSQKRCVPLVVHSLTVENVNCERIRQPGKTGNWGFEFIGRHLHRPMPVER